MNCTPGFVKGRLLKSRSQSPVGHPTFFLKKVGFDSGNPTVTPLNRSGRDFNPSPNLIAQQKSAQNIHKKLTP